MSRIVVYMNEKIRLPSKLIDGPVIKVDYPSGRELETNEAIIHYAGKPIGRIVFDPPNNPSQTHSVKAWVELWPDEGAGVQCVTS